eukprot:TRINITY_DN88170_c2_g1_i1.p1 TRINITY_DN88170_c2_g1~~TRINITY_DN88170_c2_g1_i1.p1  ORF type:complete len:1162 (-),score=130.16 TRINITY_DN88170_c2_g1_i1:2098-5583(-)
MNVQVGRLVFTSHPLFTEEDKMVVKLKKYYADYVHRTYLSLIPFLMQRVEILKEELNKRKVDPNTPPKEITFLTKSLEEATAQLEEEKATVQNMAKLLYDQWNEIKSLRQQQGYNGTAVRLVVKEHATDSGGVDYEFGLLHIDPEKTNIPADEKSRRQKLEGVEIFVKVYVNEEFVTSTKPVKVTFPNFEVDVAEQIKVYVLTMPSSIRLEVCLKGFLSSSVIAEVRTEVPGEYVKTLTSTSGLIKKLEFDQSPYSGFVFFQAEWIGTGPTMPPKILTATDAVLSKQKKAEEEKHLLETKEQKALFISKEVLFDIDAPENDWKVALLKDHYNKYMRALLKSDMLLPLHELEPARHKILKCRDIIPELKDKIIPMLEKEVMSQPQFANILKMLRHEREKKEEEKTLKKSSMLDKGTERKEAFLATLRQRQQEAKSGGSRKLRLPSHIVEEMMIDMQVSFLAECCSSIFTPRRKLRPVRKERVGQKGETISESKLIIHIVKGHNIPIRTESAPIAKRIQDYEAANLIRNDLPLAQPGGYSSRGPGFRGESTMMGQPMAPGLDHTKGLQKYVPPPSITRVETYVEVRLVTSKGTTISRTQEVEGVHPDWNEIIEIPISPQKDEFFTDAELTGTTDTLYFSLFDEIKHLKSDIEQDTIRRERRFLGSFSLPLLTVFQNPPRLEAMVKLNRPSIIFGYYTSVHNVFQVVQEEESNKQGVNPEIPTFMSISISLDPPIALPSQNEYEYYPGFEDIKLLISGTKWVKDIKANETYAKRLIALFVENARGESVFLPRYLYPQKPPEAVVNLVAQPNTEVAIEKASHFVSLIPFIADTQAFNELPDMWCTSQEFIDMGAGDYEEHAVLLCNYFNYIDKAQKRTDYETYLALGKGIPEGVSCYTLRRNKKTNHVEIWNPVTGEVYFFGNETYQRSCLCIPCPQGERVSDHDASCPLKEIGCIVSADNVYINLQPSGDPSSTLFNLDNTSYWMPFLSETSRAKYFPNGIETVQEKELTYVETPPQLTEELETKIQNFIAQEFEKARGTRTKTRRPMRTRWKRDVSEFRFSLMSLEQHKMNIRTGGRNSTLQLITKARIKEDEDKILDGVKNVTQSRQSKLQGILEKVPGGRDIFGFPINMPYTTNEAIWEEVKSTGMHRQLTMNNRFAQHSE